jgi:Ca-activated chloride channel family protein
MRYILIIMAIIYCDKAFTQAERKYIRRGNGEYNEKKYSDAEVLYRKALEKNSQNQKAEYNLSNSLYKQENYEAAATKYFNLTQQEKNKTELCRYYYNLGNSLFKADKLNESIEAYKNALRSDPDDNDARHNLQLALRMKRMENQQNQQQKNQQNQDKQKKQDQQKNQQQNPQQNQPQDQQQNQQNNPQQSERGQISREDAERLLQALENDEKKVLQKVKEKQSQLRKVPVEKDW